MHNGICSHPHIPMDDHTSTCPDCGIVPWPATEAPQPKPRRVEKRVKASTQSQIAFTQAKLALGTAKDTYLTAKGVYQAALAEYSQAKATFALAEAEYRKAHKTLTLEEFTNDV